ncbi:MAG: glycoside hydrolase family 78 protein [Acidobacteriaceae bacterium]|nr:glycoside hydrolase family 78 protein [Acidobacteriaceae bacterium]
MSALIAMVALVVGSHAEPVHLRCEHRENPLGIDASVPRLSWQNDSKERNWKQSAYQILVGSSEQAVINEKPDVWDSGKQMSAESVDVRYGGPKLESGKRYYWSVRVWDTKGAKLSLAPVASWDMGLLNSSDWKADWITWKNPDEAADLEGVKWMWVPGRDAFHEKEKSVAVFRLSVDLSEKPEDAALYIVARGGFVATVNGHLVGQKRHWQEFDRLDVTNALVPGNNVIEISVDTVRLTDINLPIGFPNDPNSRSVPAAFTGFLNVRHAGDAIERFTSGWEAQMKGETEWKPAQAVAELNDSRLTIIPVLLPQAVVQFRKVFTLEKAVKSARLYITAAGSYEARINGEKVGKDVLTPGDTDSSKRIYYQTYDVTPMLRPGANAIAALMGDGWYASPLTWDGRAYEFSPPPNRLRAQMAIEYTDGTHDVISTDSSWRAKASPILNSEIYKGETYDARLFENGWDTAHFTDDGWANAEKSEAPEGVLQAQIDRPPQVILHLEPKSVTKNGDAYIFDMGQNMVGWVTLRVQGEAGTRVRMRFAEILNPDGSIYTKNLRDAEATDTYVLSGHGEEVYAPRFTFHGFRYVEMTGLNQAPTLKAITGDVVSSVDDKPTGSLTTSSELVNKMWKIGLWGQRGNFLSIPTDCPQRDERLGWMGDAGVFWRTGAYNFNIEAFTEKWMHDVVDAQSAKGAFTNVSPDLLRSTGGRQGVPGWGDAGIIVPWTAWQQYGDTRVIRQNWDAMERWMNLIKEQSPGYLRTIDWFEGDWLAPDNRTPKDLLATAYWALATKMMSQMANAIGRENDAAKYDELFGNIRAAFQKAYVSPDGHVGPGTQTAYVVALHADLLPPNLKKPAADYLAADIESRNYHLSTGFLGTPFLLFELSGNGHSDMAYRLLMNETYPSWGYMLSKGATTWWERWNGDSGDPAMNSFNHYAFGSVMAWVYRSVAGIDTDGLHPGFREIVIRPQISNDRITSASGEYDSSYGTIKSEWKSTGKGAYVLTVTIPANTEGKVYLPMEANAKITQDGKPISPDREGLVRIGSGTYTFESR